MYSPQVTPLTDLQYSSHWAGKEWLIHRVNWAVAPEPSERTTGVILRFGSALP